MLRFSYYRTDSGDRWDLFGHLAGPWVEELRSVWRRIHERTSRGREVVNLSEVTFIDEAGEQLLVEMQGAGTDFVVAGVEHKHLIASLTSNGSGTIRRRVEDLRGGRS